MIEESLRRIVANNRATRETYSAMSSRVISAILSGSDEELENVIDELAGRIEASLGEVLPEQSQDQQSGGTDGSAVSTGEQQAATGEPGGGKPVGEEEPLG